jgi:hypothetical protein
MDADANGGGHEALAAEDIAGGRVDAYGVELLAQASELNTSGCQNGQGFLYARPMSAEAFADWLQKHSDSIHMPKQAT